MGYTKDPITLNGTFCIDNTGNLICLSAQEELIGYQPSSDVQDSWTPNNLLVHVSYGDLAIAASFLKLTPDRKLKRTARRPAYANLSFNIDKFNDINNINYASDREILTDAWLENASLEFTIQLGSGKCPVLNINLAATLQSCPG